MSFHQYPDYADSGTAWIGRVPSHWRLSPLGSFSRVSGGATPARDVPEYWGGDIPWVTAKDMKVECLDGAEEQITFAGLASCSTQLVPSGTLVMVVRSGILKHTIPVAIASVPVAINQDLKAFSFDQKNCDARFLLRWVQGFNDALLHAWGKQGATVESIEMSYLLRSTIPLPPLFEQKDIIAFLNRETAKIDALIAEQERLLALLQEKRQAVISHAVTKGLDPNVPMKDSGIEWLGQIPSHWLCDRLKRFCELRTSNVDKKTIEGQAEVRLCNYTDVYYNDFIVSTLPFMVATATESQIDRLSLKAHDVVITKDSETADDIAISAYVPESLDGVVCGYHLAVLRPGAEADGLFVKYCFDGALAKAQVEVESNGLTRVALGQYSIENLVWPWPPLAEQRAIASFINAQCKAVDSAMADAGRTVSLLRERRTALITAAVTGQIDVRGLVEAA